MHVTIRDKTSSRLLLNSLKISTCSAIILPVVLYGCEIWFLTLREEQRLGVRRTPSSGDFTAVSIEAVFCDCENPST
jgi:hypothetical protein